MLLDLLSAEAVAVLLAIAYLLLAAKENSLCWYCAFLSSAIYSVIFWDVSLLMESLLNIFYVVMAVIGWLAWRNGGDAANGISIRRLGPMHHGLIIAGILLLAVLFGWFIQHFTSAAWPFLDSFTTWASVITTFLLIYKVLESWFYWFVIDSISIYLYVDRGLYLTALLFAAYVVIVVYCYWQWRKAYLTQIN